MSEIRRPAVVALVLVVFFVVSLFTNTLGPLIPEIIRAFGLSLTAAGFLPFAFFVAYGIVSIPAGLWTERSSEKRVMTAAFALAMVAALAFATFPGYRVAIASFFAMGIAMAAIQVAANTLLRVAGGERSFALFSTAAQLVFGTGAFVSPRLYALVAAPEPSPVAAFVARLGPLRWLSLYWLFAACAALMVVVLTLAPLPSVVRTKDEQTGSLAAHRALLGTRVVPLYFVSIVMYVGSEQGVASWLSQFLATYHGVDPRTGGASATSLYWGLLTAGCAAGLVSLRLFDSRKVLLVHSACAMVLLAVGLLGSGRAASIALPAIGFFASIMWPVIVSLALSSVPAHHGTVSGILCTGIVGGAVVPLIVGQLGDWLGLRAGMAFLFLTFGWVFAVGLWARPLPPRGAAGR